VRERPYVVRDHVSPFSNVENTGITEERVREMEDRLKRDLLREADLHGGKVPLNYIYFMLICT
jgi:hypothetical protein